MNFEGKKNQSIAKLKLFRSVTLSHTQKERMLEKEINENQIEVLIFLNLSKIICIK